MPTGQTLLVTGASGQLGRRVIELLLEKGETRIIAATRTPDKLADLAARGVSIRHADFNDRASLDAAFAGVDRLLLISTDAVGVPGLRISQHVNAVEAAQAANVKHVIYTSLVEPINSPVTLAPDHSATEAALEASKIGFTVLRNNIYADGLPGTLAQALALGGKLYNACGDGKTSYVTREDCAQAAAGALASTFEGRRTLDVTGAEALSQADLAAIASEITGQTIEYVPLPLDVHIGNLVGAGLPQPIAELIASFDAASAQGKFAAVSPAVEELSGRKPIRIADFLAQHAAAIRPQ